MNVIQHYLTTSLQKTQSQPRQEHFYLTSTDTCDGTRPHSNGAQVSAQPEPTENIVECHDSFQDWLTSFHRKWPTPHIQWPQDSWHISSQCSGGTSSSYLNWAKERGDPMNPTSKRFIQHLMRQFIISSTNFTRKVSWPAPPYVKPSDWPGKGYKDVSGFEVPDTKISFGPIVGTKLFNQSMLPRKVLVMICAPVWKSTPMSGSSISTTTISH